MNGTARLKTLNTVTVTPTTGRAGRPAKRGKPHHRREVFRTIQHINVVSGRTSVLIKNGFSLLRSPQRTTGTKRRHHGNL